MRPKKLKWGGKFQEPPYINAKLQKGGTISELGYKDNSPFKSNPFLDIKSSNGSITMQNVSTPLLGVDNLGTIQTMLPNKEYGFPGSTITEMPLSKEGGMIKRADGSYSKQGLWDSIRENKGSGKKPTSQMLEQERKIKMQIGGPIDYTKFSPEHTILSRTEINKGGNPQFIMYQDVYGDGRKDVTYQDRKTGQLRANPWHTNVDRTIDFKASGNLDVSKLLIPLNQSVSKMQFGGNIVDDDLEMEQFKNGGKFTEAQYLKQRGLIDANNKGDFDNMSPNEARRILHSKKVNGQKLTPEQNRLFGYLSKGNTLKFQIGGSAKSNYDFLFGDDDKEDELNEQNISNVPSTEDIDKFNEEKNQFAQERKDWENQKQYDESMQLAMSSNDDENENDALYSGVFTPLSLSPDKSMSTTFPNLSSSTVPNFSSNGTFGMNGVSPIGMQIGNTIANNLGYKPTFNSIYRDKALNTSVGGKPNSYHLKGEAVDMKPSDWNKMSKEKQQELKSQFTVINEGNHIHFQPRKQMGGTLYSQGQTLNNLSYDDVIRLKKQGYKFSFQE